MEKIRETRDVDWLLADYADKKTKEACVAVLTAAVQLALECCKTPLSLLEIQNLLENIWYEMVPQENE